jgi:hypothetical protein
LLAPDEYGSITLRNFFDGHIPEKEHAEEISRTAEENLDHGAERSGPDRPFDIASSVGRVGGRMRA